MMGNYRDSFNDYVGQVHVASKMAGRYAMAVALGWIVFPFAVSTVLHPTDAIWAQMKLQGQPVPEVFTSQQMTAGLVEAVIALLVFVLVQLVCTVLFYRRAEIDGKKTSTPALWPIAALMTGVIGNGAWWWFTGNFDPSGAVVGWSSVVLTVAGEVLVNRLGRKFVFGNVVVGHFG